MPRKVSTSVLAAVVVLLISSRFVSTKAEEGALFLPYKESIVTLFNSFVDEKDRISWRDAGSWTVIYRERLSSTATPEQFRQNRVRVDPSHPDFISLAVPKLEEQRQLFRDADVIRVWLWTQLFSTDTGVRARLTTSRHPFLYDAPVVDANAALVIDDFDDFMEWHMSSSDKSYLLNSEPNGFVDLELVVRLSRTGVIMQGGESYNAIFATAEEVRFLVPSKMLMHCVRMEDFDQCNRLD